MPRKKKLFKSSYKKKKVNQRSIFYIVGLILVFAGLASFIALFNIIELGEESGGSILSIINEEIRGRFGILSVLIPFLMMLVAVNFFNSKKQKLVKPNITFGAVLIFASILGLLQTGQWGKFIYNNLNDDFTVLGAILILFTVFFIGLILFLNTSVDSFVIFVINALKGLIEFFKNHIFREMLNKKPQKEIKKGEMAEDKFIRDKKFDVMGRKLPEIEPVAAKQNTSSDMVMKPMSASSSAWVYPPLDLLYDYQQKEAERGDVKRNADIIEKTLDSFGIRARVAEVNNGPTVTQYALEITTGTKLSKITSLGNDLALALAAPTGQVRIEAPIPGRSLVGIEIPNIKPEIVTLKNLMTSPVFAKNPDPLLVPLGLDVSGNARAASIASMPHVLIAGTTGSGKSVLLNAWISTFLFRTRPDQLRLILVDPKRVELTGYNGIPHLLTEVIVDPEKIIKALRWVVAEMDTRYKEFSKVGARNIESYNAMDKVEKKPFIVFVIDELATLMTYAPGEAEDLITRVAQMSRATGIHLVLATQRPSVDVITGLMKANIPTRVAFNVSSMIDSRVIIDMPGSEKLLGRGDMLFLPPDQAKPQRIQGPYITEKEVNQVVTFLRSQVPEVHYTQEVTEQSELGSGGITGGMRGGGGNNDPLFNQALELVIQANSASASLLQRRLSIGYARAARILDQLNAAGFVGPAEGSKPREILRRGTEQTEG